MNNDICQAIFVYCDFYVPEAYVFSEDLGGLVWIG